MEWCKLYARLPGDPAILAAGEQAAWLFVLSLCYCAQEESDGFIPAAQLPRFGLPSIRKRVDALVKQKLWTPVDDGWEVTNWRARQSSKADLTASRAASAARQVVSKSPELRRSVRARDHDKCRYCAVAVRWTDRRGGQGGTYDHIIPDGPTEADNLVVCCRACNAKKGRRTPAEAGMVLMGPPGGLKSEPSSDLSPNLVPDLDPTQTRVRVRVDTEEEGPNGPSPTKNSSSKNSSSVTRDTRATRAPDDFAITPSMRAWAHTNDIICDLDTETATFLDHHRAKGSTFKDWQAAWRTWMRNTLKFNRTGAGRPSGYQPFQNYSEADYLRGSKL